MPDTPATAVPALPTAVGRLAAPDAATLGRPPAAVPPPAAFAAPMTSPIPLPPLRSGLSPQQLLQLRFQAASFGRPSLTPLPKPKPPPEPELSGYDRLMAAVKRPVRSAADDFFSRWYKRWSPPPGAPNAG